MFLKFLPLVLFWIFISNYSLYAQHGAKPELEITASLNFGLNEGYPLGGFGSNAKGLWRVGKGNDAIVATLGFDRLYDEFAFDAYSYNFLLTSAGYRKRINNLFIEPKLGIGLGNDFDEDSFTGFIGVEPGIEKKQFRFSLDYRFISSGGLIEGDHFHTLAFRVGYRIF